MAAFTFQSAYDGAVSDANVGHRVVVAAVKAAQDIWAAESSTPTKRTALCTTVLNNPTGLLQSWLLVCATDPTIVTAGVLPTDAQILTAIKNAWSAMAGT